MRTVRRSTLEMFPGRTLLFTKTSKNHPQKWQALNGCQKNVIESALGKSPIQHEFK